ncbi:NAD(P)-binding domain-containing protein [Bradyrhizobium commune]|uniref:NAD(P)-binding domain-containing protein n=1 Tax=Bradyrhizobium commune TaxID=83627 RepID=UPI001FEF1BBC|nr:NAD(P)-binding domain-containing protein [Bradyrhizobium commune]
MVAELGPSIKAGTAREAASADIVLTAVRWVDLERASQGLPVCNGRIVIDATNPVEFIERVGHFPVDLGVLNVGEPLASLPFGSLAASNLVKI